MKLVDPYGEMLEQSWEKYATKLAQAEYVLVIVLFSDIQLNFPPPTLLACNGKFGINISGKLNECISVVNPNLFEFSKNCYIIKLDVFWVSKARIFFEMT